MLVKIIGAALLVVGGLLALKWLLLPVLWALLSVAVVGALVWGGWRLLRS